MHSVFFFFFQAEDGIRDHCVTGVQTCALPIFRLLSQARCAPRGHFDRENAIWYEIRLIATSLVPCVAGGGGGRRLRSRPPLPPPPRPRRRPPRRRSGAGGARARRVCARRGVERRRGACSWLWWF